VVRRSTKACKVIFCMWVPEDKEFFAYLKTLVGQDMSRILKRFVVTGSKIPQEYACVPVLSGRINGKIEEKILWMDTNDSFEKDIVETYSKTISPQIYMRAIAMAGWNLFRGAIPFGPAGNNTGNFTVSNGKSFVDEPFSQRTVPLPPEQKEDQNGPPKDDSYNILRGLIG